MIVSARRGSAAVDWTQPRDGTNVRYLLQVAAQQGAAAGDLLQRSDLTVERLEAGEPFQLWQELAVIRNVASRCGAPGLGLAVGRCYHLTSLGLLGYAMLASRTLGEAVQVSDRFRALTLSICPVRLTPVEHGLWMSLDASVLPEDARRLVVERGLAAWVNVFGELLQRRFVPVQIRLDVPGAGTASGYAAHFGCPVEIDAGGNGLLIGTADLHRPLPQANAQTQQTCAELCQRLCDGVSEPRGPLTREVLRRVMAAPARLCRAADVAAALGLSERTLHRRLSAEGQVFGPLVDQVRRHLAERLLRDSGLGLEGIARQLGYAEAASFSRAFKRWTGLAPDRWRRDAAALSRAAAGSAPAEPRSTPSSRP